MDRSRKGIRNRHGKPRFQSGKCGQQPQGERAGENSDEDAGGRRNGSEAAERGHKRKLTEHQRGDLIRQKLTAEPDKSKSLRSTTKEIDQRGILERCLEHRVIRR